jgi:hypothetical protein
MGELCHRFQQGRASQRPLSRFASPFDRSFDQTRLLKVMRQ